MSLRPYAESLKLTKEEKEKALLPNRVKQAKTQAQLELLKLDEEIATAEAGREELVQKFPINWGAILDASDRLALALRRKEQLAKLISELFPGP
jgi:hypothetical protein